MSCFRVFQYFLKNKTFGRNSELITELEKTKLHAMTSKGLPNSRQRLAFAHSIISNLKAKFTR